VEEKRILQRRLNKKLEGKSRTIQRKTRPVLGKPMRGKESSSARVERGRRGREDAKNHSRVKQEYRKITCAKYGVRKKKAPTKKNSQVVKRTKIILKRIRGGEKRNVKKEMTARYSKVR